MDIATNHAAHENQFEMLEFNKRSVAFGVIKKKRYFSLKIISLLFIFVKFTNKFLMFLRIAIFWMILDYNLINFLKTHS